MTQQHNSSGQETGGSSGKGHGFPWRLMGLVALGLILLAVDYWTAVRIVEIEKPERVRARGGEISITYDRPVQERLYEFHGEKASADVRYSGDNRTHTYSLKAPTDWNQEIELVLREPDEGHYFGATLGLFKPRASIPVTVDHQHVSLKGVIPTESSNPAPEALNNQIVLEFEGQLQREHETGTNISPAELDFIRRTPEVPGYYQWSDENTLTFNFTEKRPQFETTYTFTLKPEKLIDSEWQVWDGDTEASITTSTNEVYVDEVSPQGDLDWKTPLVIEFSGRMVGALDVLKKKSPSVVPIEIEPETKGHWKWTNASTIKFVPDNDAGWPARTHIQVDVKSAINREQDREWREVPGKSSFERYVKPRKQSIRSYSLRGDSVSLDAALNVRFSRDMVGEGAVNREWSGTPPLHFEPDVHGTFRWVSRDRIQFEPDNLWSELTNYEVKLNPEFNPDPRFTWTGTKKFDFKTEENLVTLDYLATVEPEISPSRVLSRLDEFRVGEELAPEAHLWIQFGQSLRNHLPEDFALGAAIRIRPSVEGEFHWVSPSVVRFEPERHWPENQTFDLRVTDQLFHHPEQHYPEGANQKQLKVGEDRIQVDLQAPELARLSEGQARWRMAPDGALELTFNKPMTPRLQIGRTYRAEDVKPESRPYQLEPSVAHELRWIDRRHLKLMPVNYWPAETRLRLTLAEAIRPDPQAQYEHEGSLELNTGPNIVSLDEIKPNGRAPRRTPIELGFTKRIRPADTPVGTRDQSGLASLEPELAGQWVWVADDRLVFRPDELLQKATRYEIRIDPERIQNDEFVWEKPLEPDQDRHPVETVSVATRALHVQDASARFDFDPEDFLKQRFYLDIELSVPVPVDELERRFTIWFYREGDDGDRVKVPLVYNLRKTGDAPDGQVQRFAMVSNWIDRPNEDRRIHYRIKEGLAPSVGNRPLRHDYRSDFLQEKPKHISIKRFEWKEKDGQFQALLDLSSPVSPDRLDEYMTLRPASDDEKSLDIEIGVASTSSNNKRFRYKLDGSFRPGERYQLEIRRGMLAEDGAFTPELRDVSSRVPDLDRRLEFATGGNMIAREDSQAVPLDITNVQRFRVEVERIFSNNVNYFINNKINDTSLSTVAREVDEKLVRTASLFAHKGEGARENNQLEATIDLRQLLPQTRHGLYRISLRSRDSGSTLVDRRWFMATDIGLEARRFGGKLVVWANSLNNLKPAQGTRIQAYDRWNQVVDTARVDREGFATLDVPRGHNTTHVVAKRDDDMAALDFGKHVDKLSGFSTAGLDSDKHNLRSYIYSERGAYRPGDTVHLVAVTREDGGGLPRQLPVEFSLTSPQGKKIVSESYRVSSEGVFVYDYAVPADAKTGKWRARVRRGSKNLGTYEFQVEEFVPNKIKVDLELLSDSLVPGGKLRFKVTGTNLYGPPAAGRRVQASVSLRPSYFTPDGYAKFSFGHDESDFQRINKDLVEAKLDNEGEKVYEYDVPESIDSPIGVEAHFNATVTDDGGRGVSEYSKADVRLFSQYVGARRLSRAEAEVGSATGFQVVNVDGQGEPLPRKQQSLEVRVYRDKSVTHYRKNERGYFRYVTEKKRELMAELGDPRDEQGKFTFTPEHSGDYVLEVTDTVGGQVTRVPFEVRGRRSTVDRVIASDRVQLKVLDDKARVGEPVRVEVRTPFPGKVLLTGEREDVLFRKVLDMEGTRETLTLPVTEAHFPNFYLAAMAIAPASRATPERTAYARGLQNVTVTDPRQKLQSHLLAPDQVKPDREMTVGVQLKNQSGRPAEDVQFTLAAVDVGILDLTDFETPAMGGYFNRKHRLGVTHYSLYPALMPPRDLVKASIAPSGDAPSRALVEKRRVNPDSQQRIDSVALFSGVNETNEQGFAEVDFQMPDFNGRVRLMLVAFGDQAFASDEEEVIVRDNLVVQPHLPRFLANGDEFTMPVSITNGTDRQDNIDVAAEVNDRANLLGPSTRRVNLAPGEERMVDFAFRVEQGTGVAEFQVHAEGGGETTTKDTRVPVRSPGTRVTRGDSGTVDKQTPKTVELPTDEFRPGSAQLGMRISSNRLVRFRNSLDYLLRYPHGCLEQTTSKAFPLLYFSSMAAMVGEQFDAEHSPRHYTREAVHKIERMQRPDGSFSYWEGTSNHNSWSTIYASHFLVEAREAGLEVDEASWNNMLHHLNERSRDSLDEDRLYESRNGASHAVYRLYVLALAGENVGSRLNQIRDSIYPSLRPHDQARLAAAYYQQGKERRAREMIAEISDLSLYEQSYSRSYGSFRSNVRDLAMFLDAQVTVNPDSPRVSGLIDRLADKMEDGRWRNTQENAFAFLAIGKAAESGGALANKDEVNITLGDGTEVDFTGDLVLKTPELLKGDVRIETSGEHELRYAWQAAGVEKKAQATQKDRGLQVRRKWLDENGEPVNPEEMRQGQLVVVELTLQSLGKGTVENVAVTDLLPAGLEIENSRLSSSASLPGTRSSSEVDYVDIRDDRINLYLDVNAQPKVYYYTARAVTVGEFAVPGVYAEAMYEPEIMSRTGHDRMTVLPPADDGSGPEQR